MKKSLLTFLFTLIICGVSFAQTINIVYDSNLGLSALGAGAVDKVYMHSGSGTTAPWQHVVGNWGADDGIGEMTETSDDIWEIEVNCTEYYGAAGQPADTACLIIGMVFRDAAGTLAGRNYDNDGSGEGDDIFLTLSEDKLSYASDCDCVTAEMITAHPTTINTIPALSGLDVTPMPFNENILFNYSLDNANHVTIGIYNLMGALVATVISETQNAGTHSVNYNTSNVAAGNYIYRLTVGNNVTAGTIIKL